MSEEEYTNLDLETAEALVISAGHPKLAPALHAHAQGVRNLVQGEWGKSFVKSLEDMSERQTNAIVAAVKGELGALQREVSAIREQFQGVNDRLTASEKDRKTIHKEIAALRESFEEYKRGSKRGEVDALRREIDALKQAQGDATG